MTNFEQNYFVWKGLFISSPFRVVHRVVDIMAPNAYPLTFHLEAIPETFGTYEAAQLKADELTKKAAAESSGQ